jgi:hypothetical protein
MAWLSRLSADTDYVTGVALPMALIGVGQGDARGPFTAAGISGVAVEDAGAASGLDNVAHQAHRVGAALSAGTVMLALALAVVLALVALPDRPAELAARAASV